MTGATGTSYNYTYDANGNIETVRDNNTNVTTTYTYDKLNRLTGSSATNGNSATYTYDKASNITSMTIVTNGTTTTKTYSYEESTTWKDLLSSFNGKDMAYDNIGNPTTYKDINLSWTGRQLMTYGSNASYTYNAEGIRKSKTVNGSTTTFNLVGSTILSQTKNGQTLVFLYDGNGSLIGFKDLSADKDYFYLKNLQGDIVKIIDENKAVVATYEYDDWGKLLTSDADLTDIAELNPFRYRGYYYDTESGLYYLNSRYYDPETGRFINADTYVSTGQGLSGNNMFAYCNDNPIMCTDSEGLAPTWWQWAVSGAMVVAGTVLTATGVGGALGGSLVCAGVNSIINSYVHEASGGSSNAGWWGGLVSGALSGFGAGKAGQLLLDASSASGSEMLKLLYRGMRSAFGWGAGGSLAGATASAVVDRKSINVPEAVDDAGLNGTLTMFAGIVSGLGVAIALTPSDGVAGGISAGFGVGSEIILDIFGSCVGSFD